MVKKDPHDNDRYRNIMSTNRNKEKYKSTNTDVQMELLNNERVYWGVMQYRMGNKLNRMVYLMSDVLDILFSMILKF